MAVTKVLLRRFNVVFKVFDGSRFLWPRWRGGLEPRITYALVVADRCQEALAGHVTVVKTRDRERSHDPLHLTVIVVDLIFNVALLVCGVPPGVGFLDRQMIVGIQIQGHALIVCIHDRDLLDRFFFRYRLPFVEKGNARFREPLSEHPVE